MPGPVYVLPDVALALLQYYRARPEITALVPSSSIATQLPSSFSAPSPFVLLNVAGGQGIWPAVGDETISVDCYGVDKISAYAVARTVRAATWAIRNDTVAAGTLLSSYEEIAPQWLPDSAPTIPLPRFVARYGVIYTP